MQYYAFLRIFQSGELSWQVLQSDCLYHNFPNEISPIIILYLKPRILGQGPPPLRQTDRFGRGVYCLLCLLSEDRGMHEYSLDTIIDDRLTCNPSLSVTKLQHWLPHCSRNELELRSSGCSQNTSFGHNLNWETAPWRPERSSLVSWREIRNRNMNIKYYLSGDKVCKLKPPTKDWFGWIKLGNPSFSGSLAHNNEPWKLGLILKNDQKYRVSFFSKYFPLMFW